MRQKDDWPDLLCIEADFLALERQASAGLLADFSAIPAAAFSWHAWDQIGEERLLHFILPFLRQQIERGINKMPEIYASRLAGIQPGQILTANDWHRVPLLTKDNDPDMNLHGFREAVSLNPLLLRPADSGGSAAAFGSGGSQGASTPTFVTLQDRSREIQAWRRGHDYHGLTCGDTALYTYNTTHKGGQWMQESLLAHGVDVCIRRPEEDPLKVLENIRRYSVNTLFTVQQPYETMNLQGKASGINLHSLVEASLENPHTHGLLIADENDRRQVEFIFLGGFEIVPYALQLVEEYLDNIPVATLLGSSEAIPQACSTHPGLTPAGVCHYNQLHLLQAPHYIEILKPAGDAWIPVRKSEEGLLVYTSWARDGTIWLRYSPGDVATRLLDEGECPCGIRSPVIANVHRKDIQSQTELLLTGCAAG